MSEWDVLSFSLRLNWQDGVAHTAKSMLSQLARDRRILNFNPPREWRAVLRHPFAHPPRLYRVQDNLWHFEWGYLYPKFYRQLVAVRVTGFAARMCVQYLCRKLGLSSPIYLFWGPFQADLLPHLPRRFTVYYAYDNFEAYYVEREEWREHTRCRERLLAMHSDIAFAVSQVLADVLREKRFQHVAYLPNGVDTELFMHGDIPPEPTDIQHIPHPRIAYVGGIYEKTSICVFITIASARPVWQLVFIGHSYIRSQEKRRDFQQLCELSNVHILGTRSHSLIPAYMAKVDVGVALFDLDSSAFYCSPLKVYEYLAAGKPVVATPIPEVVNMGDMVYTAETPEQFVAKIEQALREDSPERQQQRREWARQHSWENRAKQMTEIIEQCLQR